MSRPAIWLFTLALVLDAILINGRPPHFPKFEGKRGSGGGPVHPPPARDARLTVIAWIAATVARVVSRVVGQITRTVARIKDRQAISTTLHKPARFHKITSRIDVCRRKVRMSQSGKLGLSHSRRQQRSCGNCRDHSSLATDSLGAFARDVITNAMRRLRRRSSVHCWRPLEPQILDGENGFSVPRGQGLYHYCHIAVLKRVCTGGHDTPIRAALRVVHRA